MSFYRYPEYKNSPMELLGEVPAYWCVGRLKHLLKIRGGQDYKSVESCDPTDIPVIGSGGQFTYATEFLYEGESVLLGRKGTIDKPLYVEGKFWTVDTMFYTEVLPGTNGRYAYYAALTIPFSLYSTSTALPSMNQFDLANHSLPLPSYYEQTQIARFLDHETAKIDSLIEQQQCLIELLKEKRQGLALTAYFDTNFQEMRLENAVDVIARPVHQQDDEEYVALGLYNRGRGLFHKDPKVKSDMGDSDFYWIESGDLILSGQFAWEGAVALAGETETGTVVSHRYPIIRGKGGVALTEYIFALLTTEHGDFLLNENSRGAAGRNRPLNLGSLLKEKIKIPPPLIQAKIAKLIHKERAIREEAESQKSLLLEHRSALISAAVTGKIDVRNWQPPASEAEQESQQEVAHG